MDVSLVLTECVENVDAPDGMGNTVLDKQKCAHCGYLMKMEPMDLLETTSGKVGNKEKGGDKA